MRRRTLFTSDDHLLHVRCAEQWRPFGDAKTMSEALIGRYNEVVDDGDLVIILGDLCMGPINESLAMVERLKGEKLYLPGNHCRCHPCYYDGKTPEKAAEKAREWTVRYEAVGLQVLDCDPAYPNRFEFADGTVVLLSHFPWKRSGADREGVEERYSEWRLEDDGSSWLLGGHLHQHVQGRLSQRFYDVGVDAHNYYPVSEDDVLAAIKAAA